MTTPTGRDYITQQIAEAEHEAAVAGTDYLRDRWQLVADGWRRMRDRLDEAETRKGAD